MPACRSRCSPTRCGARPAASPTPMLALGSRKWVGSNCAWQSVKCRKLTLPKRGTSYNSRATWARAAPSGAPQAAAAARALRNSRRFTTAYGKRPSLIYGRVRVEQQRGDVLDLLLGEDAVMPEARHVGAGAESLRVVALAVGVALDRLACAAQLAEVVEARADGAVGDLRLGQLVAGVTVGARGSLRIIVELHPLAVLRNTLAALPVADQLAVGGVPDRRKILLLDAGGSLLGKFLRRRLAAQLLGLVLVQALELGLSALVERGLHELQRLLRSFLVAHAGAARRNGRDTCQYCREISGF